MTINAEKVFGIACALKPIYDAQQRRYIEFLEELDNLGKETAWDKSVKEYRRAVIDHAGALGQALGINPAYIKMVMGVRGQIIVWTPESFRQMANYERFNPNYWVHEQAVKKHNFEFPVGGENV
jgi:hypothetical protein